MKYFYQPFGKNIIIGLSGTQPEIELAFNSFYNYEGIKTDSARNVDDYLHWECRNGETSFAYFITSLLDLDKYLYNSSLAKLLNETGEDLDNNDEPSLLQHKLSIEIGKQRFAEWRQENFYARPRNFSEYAVST